MILKRNIFFLFLLSLQLFPFISYGQNADSLTLIKKQEKEDSLILSAQFDLLELKKEAGDKKGLSIAYHNVAQFFYDRKEYENAIEYFMLTLIECRELHDDEGIANCYQSLADAHKNLEHYAEGIRYYSDAIEVYIELGYRNNTADCYLNISKIYEIKNNISQAKSYTRNAQNIYTYTRNKEKVSECIERLKYLKSKR